MSVADDEVLAAIGVVEEFAKRMAGDEFQRELYRVVEAARAGLPKTRKMWRVSVAQPGGIFMPTDYHSLLTAVRYAETALNRGAHVAISPVEVPA